MSDLVPTVIPLTDGLDLSSPQMLTPPGSMIDCLNYELVDFLGYRRISGFSRYDGNVDFTDAQTTRVFYGQVTLSGGTPAFFDENLLFLDNDGNIAGFLFRYDTVVQPGPDDYFATFVSFTDAQRVDMDLGYVSFKTVVDEDLTETAITQAQQEALDAALRALVSPAPATPVGLQWHRNNLYAVIPQLMIPYAASNNNQVVGYTVGGTVTTTLGPGTAVVRDKVITTPAGVSNPESGWLVVENLDTGSLDGTGAETLGGAISVSAGSVFHGNGNLSGMTSTACSAWIAQRPNIFTGGGPVVTPGWEELPLTYTLQVTLSGITSEFKARRRGNTALESTYYLDDGVDTVTAELLDWYVLSGSYAGGDAVLALQFVYPNDDITTSFDLFSDSGATAKLGDVTARMALNSLPGYPQLKTASSRYQFINANFYASDATDATYGANGVSRGFALGGGIPGVTFIYTQPDSSLDNPRHVENHMYHLAFGFKPGSVQLSVVGQPTNFDGLLGASEFGVGDTLTGLMSLAGQTLAVFCTSSIHSIVGAVVDSFSLQVVAPKTGCVEYSLTDMGEPIYLDSRGICSLATSSNYGDFVDGRLSTKVSSYLRRKLKRSLVGSSTSAGVACAIPVREKNQYRVFFNDGSIMTATMKGKENQPGFTFQKYFLNPLSTTDFTSTIVPFAWTSEVDEIGTERIFVSHYNEDALNTSSYVYALESGDSFDGNYLPHYFTTNWYFGESPAVYQTLHSIRLHGLSKGVASIGVSASGAQNDLSFGANGFSTTATPINLPRTAQSIVSEFQPVTNRTDIAARGLAIQLKFSGSNTDLTTIEPSHVAQVLITYSTPDGAFDL